MFKKNFFIFLFLLNFYNLKSMMIIDKPETNPENHELPNKMNQIYSKIMMDFIKWNMSFCDGDEENLMTIISNIIKQEPSLPEDEVVKIAIKKYLN